MAGVAKLQAFSLTSCHCVFTDSEVYFISRQENKVSHCTLLRFNVSFIACSESSINHIGS